MGGLTADEDEPPAWQAARGSFPTGCRPGRHSQPVGAKDNGSSAWGLPSSKLACAATTLGCPQMFLDSRCGNAWDLPILSHHHPVLPARLVQPVLTAKSEPEATTLLSLH